MINGPWKYSSRSSRKLLQEISSKTSSKILSTIAHGIDPRTM